MYVNVAKRWCEQLSFRKTARSSGHIVPCTGICYASYLLLSRFSHIHSLTRSFDFDVRNFFMGEKLLYYQRRKEAVDSNGDRACQLCVLNSCILRSCLDKHEPIYNGPGRQHFDSWKEVLCSKKKTVLMNQTGHFFLLPMKVDQEAFKSLSGCSIDVEWTKLGYQTSSSSGWWELS